ncbi:MAG: hypothetical protein OHK0046_20670 [Anaerolineae bacterium]
MQLEVIRASIDDSTTMRNLFQFYLYEFSRFTGWRTTHAGLFYDDDLEGCWTNPQRHPYLFRVKDDWAGFAIIDTLEKARYNDQTNVIDMAEFFIMGGYQGKGYGEQAATRLFEMYPGPWEVFQMAENTRAQQFWRKVIGRYTNGSYEEIEYGERRHAVQFFTSKP